MEDEVSKLVGKISAEMKRRGFTTVEEDARVIVGLNGVDLVEVLVLPEDTERPEEEVFDAVEEHVRDYLASKLNDEIEDDDQKMNSDISELVVFTDLIAKSDRIREKVQMRKKGLDR